MARSGSRGQTTLSSDLRRMAERNKHLKKHLVWFKKITGEYPVLVEEPKKEHEDSPNILYPVGDLLFSHVYSGPGHDRKYFAIEPELGDTETKKFNGIKQRILDQSVNYGPPSSEKEFDAMIEELLNKTTRVLDGNRGSFLFKLVDWLKKLFGYEIVKVSNYQYKKFRYRLNRDIIGLGPLEPLLRDPENEDIHVVSPNQIFVEHGVFGLTQTNVEFNSEEQMDRFIRSTAERVGSPVSDSDPIVDATLPDGSRLNLVYSDDVSIKGPTLTIRQQDETPLTIAQITKWGTFSPKAAAYMWLALENDMSAFVVGETASGKTTSLNALLSFIPNDSKIYTAEETAEVVPPHEAWQQLLTRESEGEGEVTMFDLVKTALRSRPDYIIVGEVRGREGRMAFQAMQTGHPVMCTFHAEDVESMVQRFTSDPINVPETFFGNLNIAIFQNYIKRKGEDLRRVTSIVEIEGYSEELGGIVTREVFEWDPVEDEVIFKGMNNSYILEQKIAEKKGYEDRRRIYLDLKLRENILEAMIREGITGYNEVNEAINAFQREGLEGLPFDVKKPEGMEGMRGV